MLNWTYLIMQQKLKEEAGINTPNLATKLDSAVLKVGGT